MRGKSKIPYSGNSTSQFFVLYEFAQGFFLVQSDGDLPVLHEIMKLTSNLLTLIFQLVLCLSVSFSYFTRLFSIWSCALILNLPCSDHVD